MTEQTNAGTKDKERYMTPEDMELYPAAVLAVHLAARDTKAFADALITPPAPSAKLQEAALRRRTSKRKNQRVRTIGVGGYSGRAVGPE